MGAHNYLNVFDMTRPLSARIKPRPLELEVDLYQLNNSEAEVFSLTCMAHSRGFILKQDMNGFYLAVLLVSSLTC